MADYNFGMAQIKAGKGDYAEADHLFELAKQEQIAHENGMGAGGVCEKQAETFVRRGQIERAIALYQEAIALYRRESDFFQGAPANYLDHTLEPQSETFARLAELHGLMNDAVAQEECKTERRRIQEAIEKRKMEPPPVRRVPSLSSEGVLLFVYFDGFTMRLLSAELEVRQDGSAAITMSRHMPVRNYSGPVELPEECARLISRVINWAETIGYPDRYPGELDGAGMSVFHIRLLNRVHTVTVEFSFPRERPEHEEDLFELSNALSRFTGQLADEKFGQ